MKQYDLDFAIFIPALTLSLLSDQIWRNILARGDFDYIVVGSGFTALDQSLRTTLSLTGMVSIQATRCLRNKSRACSLENQFASGLAVDKLYKEVLSHSYSGVHSPRTCNKQTFKGLSSGKVGMWTVRSCL